MKHSIADIQPGRTVELEIESLGFEGPGVARLDNFVIFVPLALPGDKIKASITKKKSNFAQARLIELLEPSRFRIGARCSHFGTCGGCKWQNLEYPRQVEYKTRQVVETLQHLGGFESPTVLPALPAPEPFFYRNKMEYSFSTDFRGETILGLHVAGSYDNVFDLQACFLQSEISNQIVHKVKAFCRSEKLPVYDLKTHGGLLRFLVVKEAKNTGEMMVNIVTHQGEAGRLKILAEELGREFPRIKSVVRNINSRKAQIAVGEKEELLAGRDYIQETLGGFSFRISANSFFQSNSAQAEALCRLATEFAGLDKNQTVLDLYSGTGTISFFLAQKAKEIVGVESNPAAVEDARKNAELNQIANCRFVCSDACDFISEIMSGGERFNVVVADPPRSGLHPGVMKNLLRLLPPRMVYVSCNPSTLARDLKILCEQKYKFEKVQPVDMVPHTYHIESVTLLVRKKSG